MEEYELRPKIISKKTKNLLKNYVLTIINNKNEVNQNLKPEDLNIILSSGNGRKKKIFYSLSIINALFDPKTYSKKNIEKFNELKNLIEPLDEEGIYPFNEFEELEFNFVPKLQKGLKFNLNSFEFKVLKEEEEIKTFDKSFFDSKYDNKKLFCVYTTKLNGKRHKFKKIIELVETALNNEEKFFKIFKKVLIILEIKSLNEIEPEFVNFPLELREISENENFANFEILYNIKKEGDDNSPSDIFTNNDMGRTYYFILNSDNYITYIKNLYSPEHLVKELVEKKNDNDEINEDMINNNSNLDMKINAFYEFYEFLQKIKEVKYYFYLSYHFNLILNYNQKLDKLIIKDIFFSRFNGEFRPPEYKKLKRLLSIFCPEHIEFREIEAIDIDIDFSDMTCIKCSTKIKNNEELFYCYICKDKYCYECVKDHMESNSGKDKFIDPKHNLIFFKTRDKKNFYGIDKYKLGNNLFANTDEENLGRFKKVQCNGCSVQFATSARYICLTCKPGLKRSEGYTDYCSDCIEHMMKNDKKGQDLQNMREYVYNTDINLLSEDYTAIYHNHNTHIYLLVPLACNEEENPYYDY